MPPIYLPRRKRIDVDNYVRWDTTTDFGYWSDEEAIQRWITERDYPEDWSYEEIDHEEES